MATQQAVEAAKQEARILAKDFAADAQCADDKHLGWITLYTWVYEGSPDGVSGPVGDFTESQLNEIFDAGKKALA